MIHLSWSWIWLRVLVSWCSLRPWCKKNCRRGFYTDSIGVQLLPAVVCVRAGENEPLWFMKMASGGTRCVVIHLYLCGGCTHCGTLLRSAHNSARDSDIPLKASALKFYMTAVWLKCWCKIVSGLLSIFSFSNWWFTDTRFLTDLWPSLLYPCHHQPPHLLLFLTVTDDSTSRCGCHGIKVSHVTLMYELGPSIWGTYVCVWVQASSVLLVFFNKSTNGVQKLQDNVEREAIVDYLIMRLATRL